MKMISDLAVRCEQGCCRVFGKPNHKSKGRKIERRALKRGKTENKWKSEIQFVLVIDLCPGGVIGRRGGLKIP